jgi:hypothetical protein
MVASKHNKALERFRRIFPGVSHATSWIFPQVLPSVPFANKFEVFRKKGRKKKKKEEGGMVVIILQ